MSRFNAQAQKGYYKTPTHLLPVISRYVSCSDPENARVLDPCAGEGEAIEHLGLGLGLSTSRIYANELDEPRALACEKRGLVSLCGDAVHELDAPLGGFQLVFLNPPYDEEADGSGRTERKFLSTIRFLQQNGILVYIVPLFVLQTRNVFERLTRSFHNIGMLRFPDPDYAVYGQCVLIACHGRGDMEQEKNGLRRCWNTLPFWGNTVRNRGSFRLPVCVSSLFRFSPNTSPRVKSRLCWLDLWPGPNASSVWFAARNVPPAVSCRCVPAIRP